MHVPRNRVRKGRIQKAIKIDAAVCLPRSERCGRKNGGRLLLVIVMPVFWAVCVWDLGPGCRLTSAPKRQNQFKLDYVLRLPAGNRRRENALRSAFLI
ncbi:hypothetical protein G3920_07560 [Neisseria meningitidis]|nr:hypothetical protein A6J54_01615 [Neisseria meningitidis]ARC09670.1 hypothetical protein A6J50_04190 [Neisseria meningitidis]MBG8580068.1 hypothetical protein [Neisseria meningitidis]MBG8668180.1 hypothetical protein [Neisseria meningitidis]MBG8691158.1 hypothetical protein [Neisseria meningitidis]